MIESTKGERQKKKILMVLYQLSEWYEYILVSPERVERVLAPAIV